MFDGGQFIGIHHGARAKIFDEGEVVRVSEFCDFGDLGFSNEAVDVEV